jgi:hypothetical protein
MTVRHRGKLRTATPTRTPVKDLSMTTVAHRPTKIQHFAIYPIAGEDAYGIATLINGSGYFFVPEGQRKGILIDYRNSDLQLMGRCDLVAAADAADGDRVVRCSQTVRS